jgi:hypothetical protein
MKIIVKDRIFIIYTIEDLKCDKSHFTERVIFGFGNSTKLPDELQEWLLLDK